MLKVIAKCTLTNKATKCIIIEVLFECIYDLGPYDHMRMT